jgi:hypothetical protein
LLERRRIDLSHNLLLRYARKHIAQFINDREHILLIGSKPLGVPDPIIPSDPLFILLFTLILTLFSFFKLPDILFLTGDLLSMLKDL